MGYISEYLAIKTTFNNNIYLVRTGEFIPDKGEIVICGI